MGGELSGDAHARRVWAMVGAHGPSVRHLCEMAARLLPDVTGIGMSAAGDRRFSSDAASSRVEELQETLDEGPCRDVEGGAARSAVLATDLTDASWRQRWPRFTPGALTAGVRALLALPLHAGGVRHDGGIDLYRAAPGHWRQSHLDEADAFAGAVTELITLERLGLDLSGAFTRAREPTPASATDDAVLLVHWFAAEPAAPLLRRLRTLCAAHDLAGAATHRFTLAVQAGITNAVRHGGGSGQLLLWRTAGHLWCEIADHGPGIPPAALAVNRAATPDTDWSTGWGLTVIRHACTVVDITTDRTGTRLLLGMRLPLTRP